MHQTPVWKFAKKTNMSGTALLVQTRNTGKSFKTVHTYVRILIGKAEMCHFTAFWYHCYSTLELTIYIHNM